MDILDNVLEVGGYGDFVTPALSLAGQALGQTHMIGVPLDLMVEVEIALKEEGFTMMRGSINGDVFIFDVPMASYKLVLQLLRREFGLEYR